MTGAASIRRWRLGCSNGLPRPLGRGESGERRYGLGLALVAEIAAAHEGRVTLLDTTGGATFRLSIPPAAADPSARPPRKL